LKCSLIAVFQPVEENIIVALDLRPLAYHANVTNQNQTSTRSMRLCLWYRNSKFFTVLVSH